MMMFLGVTSLRNSGGSCCRRQRLRMATATAFFAASCPTMYLSSSATIWRGVMESATGVPFQKQKSAAKLFSLTEFLHVDVAVRVDADVAGDLQARADNLRRLELGVRH